MNVHLIYLTDLDGNTIKENIAVYLDGRKALVTAIYLNNTKPDTVTGVYQVMNLKLETGTL